MQEMPPSLPLSLNRSWEEESGDSVVCCGIGSSQPGRQDGAPDDGASLSAAPHRGGDKSGLPVVKAETVMMDAVWRPLNVTTTPRDMCACTCVSMCV